eukprot:gene24790-29954_t
MSIVPVRGQDIQGAEVAWFAPLCSDDFRHLGVPEGDLRSSWANTSRIVERADQLGFRNILCPSSYQVGQDTLTFAAAVAHKTQRMNLLAAIRCGETHPAMLARTVATLDHILEGRLTLNVISSDFPGQQEDSAYRYRRSWEVVEILKQAWTQDEINYDGEIYQLKGLSTDPVKPYQTNGGPLLYFGGYSPDALALCGAHCDTYLMWPEPKDVLAQRMRDVHAQAAKHGRLLDYGLRVHMIVRDTQAEAREYAAELVSQLDDEKGREIRRRALDAGSLGVSLQSANRDRADDEGYIEPHLWTGVGRARSGCGAALVGSVDQVLSEIEAYQKMGIRAFIFSGYPHLQECEIFGTKVLPQLKTVSSQMSSNHIGRITLPNGRSLSRMAYGVWRLSEATDHSVNTNLARIDACLAQGITTFDHADIYGNYSCEELFGHAIKARPSLKDQIEIVTKTDIMLLSDKWPNTRVKHYDTSAAHVTASVECSLSRIGVDVIDLLLIHRPDPLMDAQALGACLDGLIDSGKLRGVGVSNFMPWDVDLLQSCMKHKLQTNQLELSLLHTAPFTNGQLAHAQQHRMPVMAWSPLGGGRLHSQAGTPGTAAARLALKLETLARAAGTDTTAVAMAWLMHHPVGVVPVMGSNQLDRIARFGDAARVPMDRQTWYELYELANGHEVP